ncbi:MAG TPA: CocE/NonD family hydrolase [Steroidobacteraceae bacterium]|nr:CocE/NonD family hydrolase [Steroidobacteraceae bacterium]
MIELRRLAEFAPDLKRVLDRNAILSPLRFAMPEVRYETVKVLMRDGVELATDVYLPPVSRAPTIAVRTPYGRGADSMAGICLSLARRGYVVVSQDCRGTGDSQPDQWDYYMYEPEDGYDFVEWIAGQPWFDGFVGSFGGSYCGQTQWQMAMHPMMSSIAPEVSGLGVAVNTAHLHMVCNVYARTVGKGDEKIPVPFFELEGRMLGETLATGYFNEPLRKPLAELLLAQFPQLQKVSASAAQRWLWEHYCALSCARRSELVKQITGVKNVSMVEVESLSSVFGHRISHDAHTLPHPQPETLCASMHAPVMLCTGWYDWALNDALATWQLLQAAAPSRMRSRCRLLITPSAHNAPGYHEGVGEHPELQHAHRGTSNIELLLRWHGAVREEKLHDWPKIIYYLMGANEWYCATAWPPPEARAINLYLGPDGVLGPNLPPRDSTPDRYTYDPTNPTPTVGGSIVSYVYPPGSVDVSRVQKRADVLTYTTPPLERDMNVVGPLRLILYASSSAVDTDFVARLSDVFPDQRAIQLQSGILRARYRNLQGEPELLEPGRVYRLEIDMWATANRFKAGHCVRLDISSADFPHFDRNTNLGGLPGPPVRAEQSIYHDAERSSQLLMMGIV